jgi:hypothetical protein
MIADDLCLRLRDRGQNGLGSKEAEMKRTIYSVIYGMSITVLANICAAQAAEKKFIIRKSDFVMSEEEASKFSDQVLSPIVFGFARSESAEPEALRNRIRTLLKKIRTHEIDYVAVPAYYPIRELRVLAKVQQLDSKPTLILFVPEVVEWRKTLSESDFKYGLLITLAHEMIHLELGHDQDRSDKEAARHEADAWSRTILEIIRPLQSSGVANIPQFNELSDCLKSAKDDPSNPNWLRIFKRR